jgi:molybdopterin-binding protein
MPRKPYHKEAGPFLFFKISRVNNRSQSHRYIDKKRNSRYSLLPFNPMKPDKLYSPSEAAQVLGISYSTVKVWIYEGKIRTAKTAGGHHRIPERELDKFLYRVSQTSEVSSRRRNFRRVSGRNQLVGRVTNIKVSGLIAQLSLSIGGQHIISIISADAVREMRLRKGQTVAALIKSTEVMLLRL